MTTELLPTIAGRSSQAVSEAVIGYTRRQIDTCATVIGMLRHRAPSLLDDVLGALHDASPLDIDRVLTAPVLTHQLRTRARHSPECFARQLLERLRTEQAARGTRSAAPTTQWTALGDTQVWADRDCHTPISVSGLRAVDIASPQALTMDAVSALCGPDARPAPGPAVIDTVATLLGDALTALQNISPELHQLVSGCMLSLVITEQPSLRFSSSTHGLYVGRATLGAGRWADVGLEHVVDGLVHEAIHCFLLMADTDAPLLVDDLAADALPPVPSPWTGNPLPVPTYVHAVMVWFGLSWLWARAAETSVLETGTTRRMVRRALHGFASDDVVARLDGARDLVSDHALETLTAMQAEITDTLLT